MFAVFKIILGNMPDCDLVWEYCAHRAATDVRIHEILATRGYVGSDLYQFLESQIVRATHLRWKVLAALTERGNHCALVTAHALNIETPYTDKNLKQMKIDTSAFNWWPGTFVCEMQKKGFFAELDCARAANISAAWSDGSEFNESRRIGAIACCDPPAIYQLAKMLKGTPEYWVALNLAKMLGDRDALIDWCIAADWYAQIERIDWHPRARFVLLQRAGRGELAEYKDLVTAGCTEARKVVGDMLLARGLNDEAADWYGHAYYTWACHARIIPANFGAIAISREGAYMRVNVSGVYSVRSIASARWHLKKALQIKVTAREDLRANIAANLKHVPVVLFDLGVPLAGNT